MSTAGDAMTFGRGNVAVLTQSMQACVARLQDFSRLQVAIVQSMTQQAVENAHALAAVKTPQDLLPVQANLTRASIERFLSDGAKLQQAAQKMKEQASAPLTEHVAAAVTQTKLAHAS
jgi:phasin family protein